MAALPEEWVRNGGRSRCGDSTNISSNEAELLNEVFPVPRLLNLNGGAWLSGAGLFIPSWNDWALLLAREGRKKLGRRLL